MFTFQTSGDNFTFSLAGTYGANENASITGSCVAEMDANDTCKVRIYMYDGDSWNYMARAFTGCLIA